MCGIAGVFEYGWGQGSLSVELIDEMRDTLLHRGPDGEGTWISEDRRVGLGHRRLAIVDPGHGAQPMFGERGEVLVFNGEIYNYPSLRRELELEGVSFETDCDTEILLRLYTREGEAFVERLVGMFAFALWDPDRESLLLARDPIGEKPLYWTARNGRLVFGSEIKALLAHPGVSAEVNPEAVAPYLANLVSVAPSTLFEGIAKLVPGTIARCDRDGVSIRSYRAMTESRSWREVSPADAAATVRGLLEESIDARLMSDVPVGVLLSGGLDSTTLVGALHARDRHLPTFSIGFAEPELDERDHARRVAKHFGTEHQEVELSEQMALSFLPTLVHHQDEPLGDPVCMPVHFVCGLAREHGVKVVLAGEGADELFWGYWRYQQTIERWRQISLILRLPRAVRTAMARAARRAHRDYVAEALEGAARGRLLPMQCPIGLPVAQREQVLGGPAPIGWEPAARGSAETALDTVAFDTQEYEFGLRLPELLLMRIDRFSMSNSVEARVPFLDPALVDYAYRLGPEHKISGGRTKQVMREAVADLVPDWVMARGKQGFGAPVERWHRLRFGELLDDLLDNPELGRFIDVETTRSMIARDRLQAWPILNFALWHRYWVEGESLDEAVAAA